MPQLQSVWTALSQQRKLVALVAAVAMFATVLVVARLASAPSMALLYGGLESGPAGEVVRSLDQRAVRYEVRGDSIWVEAPKRDEIRMTLAAEGLPANTSVGYELLDGLSGFGTTSQMFDAAYWRAKEGELARTITASPQIRAARVHIANAGTQPFRREIRPSASITVTTNGSPLPPSHAKALKNLVASAVSGLQPEDVSVIDSANGAVVATDDMANPVRSGDERAVELKRNVERLLEARVGHGKAVVELSVETVTEREQIVERRFDPDSRVAISTETEERSATSSDQGGAAVTVASNLPDGEASNGNGTSQSQTAETRDRVNYEVSETQREVLRTPGAVRRITVAVLLDGARTVGADGVEVFAPRPEAELEALRDLVASAIGYDTERGDVITIKSLEFQPVTPLGELVVSSPFAALDLMSLIQLGVLALIALILGLFVVRPILSQANARAELPAPEPARAPMALPEPSPLNGEIDELPELPMFPMMGNMGGMGGGMGMGTFGLDDPEPQIDENDPVARLRRLIEERQEESVEILRSWMEDREERA